jgi:hypothetical protein
MTTKKSFQVTSVKGQSQATLKDRCGRTEDGSYESLIGESVKGNPDERGIEGRQIIRSLLGEKRNDRAGRGTKGAFRQIGFAMVHITRFFKAWCSGRLSTRRFR